MDLALIELSSSVRNSAAITPEAVASETLHDENPKTRRANFVGELRFAIGELDALLAGLPQNPVDGARCPAALSDVGDRLVALQSSPNAAGFALTRRVVARADALVSKLQKGTTRWELLSKLAVEELVSVLDMLTDVIELVGTDSGCRHEERISLRILASVAPQVLADVDAMSFREIRFHQASVNPHTTARLG
jgi:hypothetical protein